MGPGGFHFFVLQDGLAKRNEERSAASKTMSRLCWGSVCLMHGKRAFWFEATKGRIWGKGRRDAVMERAGQWGP